MPKATKRPEEPVEVEYQIYDGNGWSASQVLEFVQNHDTVFAAEERALTVDDHEGNQYLVAGEHFILFFIETGEPHVMLKNYVVYDLDGTLYTEPVNVFRQKWVGP